MKLERSYRLQLRDILVLKVTDLADDEEAALTDLATNLSGLCRIPIIVLREGMSIDSVSEQDMVRAGWVRSEGRDNGRRHVDEAPTDAASAVADSY